MRNHNAFKHSNVIRFHNGDVNGDHHGVYFANKHGKFQSHNNGEHKRVFICNYKCYNIAVFDDNNNSEYDGNIVICRENAMPSTKQSLRFVLHICCGRLCGAGRSSVHVGRQM